MDVMITKPIIVSDTSQTLHLFPNPSKYKAHFNQWVTSIGGDIIGLDDEDIIQTLQCTMLTLKKNIVVGIID